VARKEKSCCGWKGRLVGLRKAFTDSFVIHKEPELGYQSNRFGICKALMVTAIEMVQYTDGKRRRP
jgi:hypothetical protein